MNDKITEAHRDRSAYIYIRKSTLQQVQHNVESNRRQYALRERAAALGFNSVIVVDDDLGVSGSGTQQRPGFSRLLAAVCNGEVGAVFALEASRLARNNRDWHHLIDLCVLTRTLVVDADGIYDPRLLNDRLLLGLKGTMSEFELGLLRQRAQEAYREKAHRGEVMTRVPVGFVRKGDNGIEMTPDRQVQQAIRDFFLRLQGSSSLRQVLLWHHQEKILFPVARMRDGCESLEWRLPNYQQLLRMVKNPTYAGAFAWGRSGARSKVVDGRSRKTVGHRLEMAQWQILLKDHHPGYIKWEDYQSNLDKLVSNRTKSHQSSTGAARSGSALLAGLFRCARCGHKLNVSYRGRDGRAPRYLCMEGSREREPHPVFRLVDCVLKRPSSKPFWKPANRWESKLQCGFWKHPMKSGTRSTRLSNLPWKRRDMRQAGPAANTTPPIQRTALSRRSWKTAGTWRSSRSPNWKVVLMRNAKWTTHSPNHNANGSPC